MGLFSDIWEGITGVTAAKEAGAVQTEMTELGIAEQRRQFDALQEILAPYVGAGTDALQMQSALAGAAGPEAQRAAIQGVQESPAFQAALEQGETSILQNAAATGGLRGGNTQAALAQFAPQLLGQAIDQRYSQLGGLSQLGQASAAGVGAAGMGMGQGIAGSLGQLGQQQASNILGQYNLQRGFLGDLAGLGLNIAGLF